MCGITGFIGGFSEEHLLAMSARLAHRGPDDQGHWLDPAEQVGLAHRRLAIVDLSPAGRQPMANEDGSLRLSFNGEIYNFRELRDELESKGHRFRSRTDCEVVLHLYEEEGCSAVERLDGIFAFALWDGRRRRLLLARDHLGVKPLYYAELPSGALAFASELKALLVLPGISRELDFEALHQHLTMIWAAAPHTLFQHVRKLEPGFLLSADERGVHKRPYWDLPYGLGGEAGSRAEQAERIRELLGAAVERQLMSDVPVGAFLSGGLDSSAVVAAMRSASGRPVRCYTMALDAGPTDANQADLPYARLMARDLDLDLVEIEVSPDMVVGFAERMVYLLDEPQADPACINVHLIAERARSDGYRVLLSGTGGDDIFSGYRRHVALCFEPTWRWLPRPLRALLAKSVSHAPGNGAPSRRFAKAFQHAGLDDEERLPAYFAWHEDGMVRKLYTHGVRAKLGGYQAATVLKRSLERIPTEHAPLNRMLYLEAKHFLADHNLNYTDKMAMAHGVEVRVPLLDRTLAEFAVRLPPRHKLSGFETKSIFREAMRPILPASILRRSKTGFGAPLRRWICQDLREMVRDVLSEETLRCRGIFDPRAVEDLIVANEAGRVDASYLVFSLVCVEMWLRSFAPTVASVDLRDAPLLTNGPS
ncbi:MAG TPA: asparagine synthase (glutamine-hydrolyzing) [Thermoanaerobaculia bacterium]|nr:asparagine synthase (glutamine-hydrolyzing) [Thermoanaerobaculia bacterium]